MNFKNLTLRRKLLLGFSAVTLVTVFTGIGGLISTRNVNKQVIEFSENWLPSVRYVSAMNIYINEIRLFEYRHIANTDDSKMHEIEGLIDESIQKFSENNDTYTKLISSPEEQKIYDDFKAHWKDYLKMHDQILKLSRENLNDSAKSYMLGETYTLFKDTKGLLKQLVDLNNSGGDEAAKIAADSYNTSRNISIAIIIFAIFISGFFTIFLTSQILKDIGGEPVEVSKITADVAEGNLAVHFKDKDRLTGIYGSVARMTTDLREIIEKIQVGANNVADASRQISSTSQQMSEGANEQASAVEEISSSMEQMASNIQQNTDNAVQTESISVKASQDVEKVKSASRESNDLVGQIAEKIKIINDIAFQTNILALNAAVEAARAGEHGRGFAVVAAEVRKLAERSKVSAEEINILAGRSVQATNESFELLGQIIPQIENTSKLVKEIAASSREQSIGTDQVNNAIQGLNQVTQQTAAASEELATSAEELASQAEQLKETISFFNTNS